MISKKAKKRVLKAYKKRLKKIRKRLSKVSVGSVFRFLLYSKELYELLELIGGLLEKSF